MPARPGSTVLRDPVHGDIELSREEVRILDTAEFQRLRGVKQLGTAYLVYPGATHTRFEHSVGCLHMADRLLQSINKNGSRNPGAWRHGLRQRAADPPFRGPAARRDAHAVRSQHRDQTGLVPRHDVPERYEAVLGDTELGGSSGI